MRREARRLTALFAITACLAGCATVEDAPRGPEAYAIAPPAPAVGMDYRIAPDDILRIHIYHEPDLSLEDAQVTAAGMVRMALIANYHHRSTAATGRCSRRPCPQSFYHCLAADKRHADFVADIDISCQGCQRRCPAIKPESIHSRVDSGFFLFVFLHSRFSNHAFGSLAELCLRCSETPALWLPAGQVALFST